MLTFAQESKGNDYLTGVVKGNDLSSGDYEYVGLSDSDTDLSGVDLITFVGCSTSDGSDNLCETAIDEGATTSVGFYDPITSRNYSGKRWLKYYNRGLKDGKDVEDAVDYATTKAPNSDLGDSAEIHGSETNTILSNSLPFKLVTVAYASSFTDSLHEKLADSSNIDDIEDEPIAHKVNITLSKTALTNNVVDMSASELTVELNKLFEVLVKIDESFNIDDYKVTINMYSKDKGNGMILIRYFINDMIKTNKAYVVSVRNNSISTIYESDAMMIEEVDTNRITAKATTYLSENQKNITTTTKGGDLYKSYMTYDYLNGTLSHFEVVFAIDDVTGVIVPEIKEVVIE